MLYVISIMENGLIMTDLQQWSEKQVRKISNDSGIRIDKISLLSFSMRDASIIIGQLLGEDKLKTKRQKILELKRQIEDEENKKTECERKEEQERSRRNQVPISNEDPCLNIDED